MIARPDLPDSDDFARLEADLFERIAVRHWRQVLRHRLVALAAVLVLAGAGVAAGTIANPTLQSKSAYCYSGSNASSAFAQVGLANNAHFDSKPGTTPTAARIANAVLLCKGLWRSGVFSTGSRSGAVPKLQACLRDDLIVSVFRKTKATTSAESFCNNLGLSAP